jgi:hypothetical protein
VATEVRRRLVRELMYGSNIMTYPIDNGLRVRDRGCCRTRRKNRIKLSSKTIDNFSVRTALET